MQGQSEERDEKGYQIRIFSYDFRIKAVENSVYDVPSILLAIVVLVVMSVTVSYVIYLKLRELITKTPTSERGGGQPATVVGVYFKVLRDAFGK